MNIDGATDYLNVGIGVVIYNNSYGFMAGLSRSIGRHTHGLVKLWALRDGLGFMHDNGLDRVIVESDSTFFTCLFGNKFKVGWQFQSLFTDCVELL